jgi:hypothetical protein
MKVTNNIGLNLKAIEVDEELTVIVNREAKSGEFAFDTIGEEGNEIHIKL